MAGEDRLPPSPKMSAAILGARRSDFSLERFAATHHNRQSSLPPTIPVGRLMKTSRLVWVVAVLVASTADVSAQKTADPPKTDQNKLPLSKLAPSKIIPNLCLVKYGVTTSSPECQAFFDQ